MAIKSFVNAKGEVEIHIGNDVKLDSLAQAQIEICENGKRIYGQEPTIVAEYYECVRKKAEAHRDTKCFTLKYGRYHLHLRTYILASFDSHHYYYSEWGNHNRKSDEIPVDENLVKFSYENDEYDDIAEPIKISFD